MKQARRSTESPPEKAGKTPRAEAATKNRRMGVSAERRIEQERGASRLVSGGRNAKQGIANRSADEEARRQAKVVPIRNEGKTTRKRRAG